MSANEFIQLIADLEAEGWDVPQSDWPWIANQADYHAGYNEWYASHPEYRDEALTAAERNR